MKRICTESEKVLLYKNRDQILEGIYQTASRSKLSHVFILIFLSAITMFAGIFWVGYTFDASKPVLIIWMLICFAVPYSIFSMILNTLRINKEKKSFIKKNNLMINGATLVNIDVNDQFFYIEDDFVDEEGKPIIIEYPSHLLEISQEDIGKRFLVIYDSDFNFQLARLNDELKGLIPSYSSFYPLAGELSEYSCIPHPAMANVEKSGHKLSENEKKKFADLYVKVVQSVALMNMKTAIMIMTIGGVIIFLIITTDGYPLDKTLPIGAAAWVGVVLYGYLLTCISKVNLKRQGMKFVYVKEVVFHSYIFDYNRGEVKVYEWNDGQVQLCEYPAGNVVADTVYGSILYKFTNQKGDYVLLNTSPVSKKRK